MSTLVPGDLAPLFTLPDQDGRSVSLGALGPGRVLVYFYPAALTPGCTTEAIDFTTHLDRFRQAGIEVVGVSPDPVEKLQRFTEAHALRVRLLADPAREVIEAYGAWGVKMLYGKQVAGVIRSTFVVDVAATSEARIVSADYGVRATGHVERMLAQLGI